MVFEQAEDCGRDNHRRSAGDATLDAVAYEEGFDGEDLARRFARGMGRMLDESAQAGDFDLIGANGDGDMRLVRQHLTEPADDAAMVSARPRMPTARLVTIPAKMSERPRASTMGHAVGRGSWIVLGMRFVCIEAPFFAIHLPRT